MILRRLERLRSVVNQRSRYFTFIFENFYDPHNISAGIRSIDGCGFQDVYIIMGKNSFRLNKDVTRGVHKWMNVRQVEDVRDCITRLKQEGYRVLIAEPQPDEVPLNKMEFPQKTAFLFGQEGAGVSEVSHELADGVFYIPMRGFSQSFNVSVSVAITAYSVRDYCEKQLKPEQWLLPEKERNELLELWVGDEELREEQPE